MVCYRNVLLQNIKCLEPFLQMQNNFVSTTSKTETSSLCMDRPSIRSYEYVQNVQKQYDPPLPDVSPRDATDILNVPVHAPARKKYYIAVYYEDQKTKGLNETS